MRNANVLFFICYTMWQDSKILECGHTAHSFIGPVRTQCEMLHIIYSLLHISPLASSPISKEEKNSPTTSVGTEVIGSVFRSE